MRALAFWDWAIVVVYLALTLVVGMLVSRRAGRSLDSYFVAGRSLPWWWLGTSMVATTFAADTPLVVTGLVAAHGVAGNWFWWSWAISHVSMAVIFASLWRRARVLTDAELVELRYGGRPAAVLRAFKAVFFAVLINGIVLGWVIRAMVKIAAPFIRWEEWIGAGALASFEAAWPAALTIGGPGDTITVLVLFTLIAVYSSMGGIRGVILTDLIQFTLAMVGSIAFAWIAVAEIGGLDGLISGLEQHYDADRVLAFVPGSDAAWLPVQLFLIYIAVQWWAQYFSDGSGYLAQRLFTARDVAHAQGGALVRGHQLRAAYVALGADRARRAGAVPAGHGGLRHGCRDRGGRPRDGVSGTHGRSAARGHAGSHVRLAAGRVHEHRGHAHQLGLELPGERSVSPFLPSRRIGPRAGGRQPFQRIPDGGAGSTGRGEDLEHRERMALLRRARRRPRPAIHAAVVVVAGERVDGDRRHGGCRRGRARPLPALSRRARRVPARRHCHGLDVGGAGGHVPDRAGPARAARGLRRSRPPAGLVGVAWMAAAWVAGNIGVFGLTFGIGHMLLGNPVTGTLMALAGAAAIVFTLWALAKARATTVSNVHVEGGEIEASRGQVQ